MSRGVVSKTKTTNGYATKSDLYRMLDRGGIKEKMALLI